MTNKTTKIIWTTLILITIVLLVFATYKIKQKQPLDAIKIPVNVTVGNMTGINVDSDLNFGMIIPGAGRIKTINFTNKKEYTIRLDFKAEGPVKEFLEYPKNITLKTNELKEVNITARITPYTPYGEYLGNLTVISYKNK